MGVLSRFKSNALLKSGASYSIASTSSAICTMIIGFLNMRWLGPELLGIWQSVTIITTYLPILQLGIQSGLNLELPILLGENNRTKAMQFVSTALFYAIVLSILFSLISVIAIIILIIKGVEAKVIAGVIVVCLMAIFSCYKSHYIATYRSANAFNKLSTIYWIDCIVSLSLIYVIFRYQYYGLLFFHAFKEFALTLLMFINAPYRNQKPCFYKEHFSALLKRGIFMTVFNELKGVTESMPRLVLLNTGGVVKVGIFNPALVVGTFMNLIPTQIAQFLHPQMGMKYGQTKNAKDMWPYFKALTIYVPLFLIIPALLGWVFIPFILEYAFPKYLESLWPIRIMLIGFMFGSTFFTRGFLITIKAYVIVLALQLFDLVLFVALAYAMIYWSDLDLLIALSLSLSITYLVTYLVNIIVVRHVIFLNKYNKSI